MATKSLDLERGSSQYASRADTASLSIVGALTLEGWVKAESYESGGTNAIFNKRDGNTNRSWELVVQDQGGSVYQLVGVVSQDGTSGDQSVSVSNNFNASLATWTHIAMSFATGTGAITLVQDGVELGYGSQSTNATAIFDNNAPVDIGTNRPGGSPTNFWDGKLAQMRIWNTNRSVVQINANKAIIIDAAPNLVASWQLDDSYEDGSGNLNTLTSSGSPVFSADVPTLATQTFLSSIDLELSSSQYGTRADTTSLSITGNITLETWVKWETLPATVGSDARLLNKFHSSGSNRGNYELEVTTANKLDMIYSADGTYDGGQYTERRQDTASMTSTGVWYHCKGTATVATQTITLYIDGSVVASSNIATGATAIGDQGYEFGLGARNENGTYAGFVDGKMWLARVWAEVHSTDDKCSIKPAGTANMAAQWILSDSWLDSSGNNNTLQAFGAPVFSVDIPSICSSVVYDETYTETIVLVATMPKSTIRTLTDAMTLVDTMPRSIVRTLTQVLTLVDSILTEKVIPKILTETMVMTDSIVRSITHVITNVITMVDTLPRSIDRVIVNVLTMTDTFSRVLNKFVTLTETFTLTDTVLKVLNGSSTIWTKMTKSAAATWTKMTKGGQ